MHSPSPQAEADPFPWLSHRPARDLLASLDPVLERLTGCADAQLTDLAAHLLRHGGKRLRPALLLLAADCVRTGRADAAERDRLLRAAAAVELLHVASLYHDDVMDRADVRRGTRTVNALRGDAAAVTAGTFLFARAIGVLAELDGRLATWAGQSSLALALGQLQEAENTYNLDHRVDSCLQIAARKTAALFELCCRAGALLGGAGPEGVEALGRYGRALGMAFQAVDDTLDFSDRRQELGKEPGTDLREGVYSLPVLIVLQQGTAEAQRLRELLRHDELSPADQREAAHLVTAAGGLVGALNIAQQYGRQAAEQLAGLADGEAKASLARLAEYVIIRRH